MGGVGHVWKYYIEFECLLSLDFKMSTLEADTTVSCNSYFLISSDLRAQLVEDQSEKNNMGVVLYGLIQSTTRVDLLHVGIKQLRTRCTRAGVTRVSCMVIDSSLE